MAGTGRKVWAADEILAAADLQSYIQDQVVFVFNDSTARASGILAPTEGMISYLKSTDLLYYHNGASWQPVTPTSLDASVISSGTLTRPVNTSGDITAASITATGNLYSAGASLTGTLTTTGDLNGTSITASGTLYGHGLNITGSGSLTGTLTASGDLNGTSITASGTLYGAGLSVSGAGSVGGAFTGGSLTTSGVCTFSDVYSRTNTGRAVYVSSSGVMGIGSSSERFKENIVDADIDIDSVLKIAVRAFNYREDFSDDNQTQIGVIAEELVALGLEQFVFFGDDGLPDGVAYDRLALALIPLLKVQAERLDMFEARLQILESK